MLALLSSRSVLAQSAEVPPDERQPVEQHWYGWQTLLVDAVPAALWAAAVPATGQAETTLMGIGGIGFAIGGPIVHLAHSNGPHAAATFGLRLGLPVTGVLIAGAIAYSDPNGHCGPAPATGETETCNASSMAAVGALVGAAIASGVDSAVFAYDSVKPPRRGLTGTRVTYPLLAPAVTPSADGVRLTLYGTF